MTTNISTGNPHGHPTLAPPPVTSHARNRQRMSSGRHIRVSVRLTNDEYADLVATAHQFGLTPTGYVAEAALAATRGATPDGHPDSRGINRAELARLQHELFATRTVINQLAASLTRTPQAAPLADTPTTQTLATMVARLDEITDRLHRKLQPTRRRSQPDGSPTWRAQ